MEIWATSVANARKINWMMVAISQLKDSDRWDRDSKY